MPEPTMNPRLDVLLSRVADEAATAQEWRELETLLAADPAARRRYVQMMDLHAELRARHAKASSPAAAPGLPKSPGSFAWLSWRPLTAAAAGLLLGAGEIRQRFTRSRQWAGTCQASLGR